MNISAIWENSLYSLLADSKVTTAETSKTKSQSWDSLYGISDSATISEEGLARSKMPPPPHEMDFENMSDEALKDYLEKMQEMSGKAIPGMDSDVKASDLTEEQLQTVREALSKIPEDMKSRRNMPPMPPMPEIDLDSLSDEDLISLLEKALQKTDTESEDSEDTGITTLAEEQTQITRDSLMLMLQQYLTEAHQNTRMQYAEQAYSAAGQVVSI